MVSVPVMSDGQVLGYVVTRLQFAAVTEELKDSTVQPEPFVADEAFKRIYDTTPGDMKAGRKHALRELTADIASGINKTAWPQRHQRRVYRQLDLSFQAGHDEEHMNALDSRFAFGDCVAQGRRPRRISDCVEEHDALPTCRLPDRVESARRHGGAIDLRRSRHHFGDHLHDRLSGAAIRYACDLDSSADGADCRAEHSYRRRRDETSATDRTPPSFGTHHRRRTREQQCRRCSTNRKYQ